MKFPCSILQYSLRGLAPPKEDPGALEQLPFFYFFIIESFSKFLAPPVTLLTETMVVRVEYSSAV